MRTFSLFFVFFVCISSQALFSQARLNAPGNFFSTELKQLHDLAKPPAKFISDYDLLSIDGQLHVGVLGLVDETRFDDSQLSALGVVNRTRAGNVWTFRVPLNAFIAFTQLDGLLYLEVAEPVDPFLHEALVSTRADSVHQGLGGLPEGFTGEGVIVCVIDWGFDYTHPMFYDSELNELRISRAWDQNKIIGTPPDGYDFGAEYVGPELLIAQHDTNYVFGPGSHGTHVAGIAAGAGAGLDQTFAIPGGGGAARLIGAAPDAELILISLRRDAASYTDAINYVKDYAESVGKPFVVNMSFGSHLGPHDGQDLKNVGIDNVHGPGRIFVGSAGNNGTGNFHIERNFTTQPDTLITVVNIHSSSDWGQLLSLWGSPNSSFSASIALANGMDELVFTTPFYNSADEDQLDETFEVLGGELQVRVMSTAAFTTNDKPNIRVEVRNTSPNKIVLRIASQNTHLHMWSVARMANRTTNWGVNLTANFPGAVAGDTEYAPGEPGGCGQNVITVGSYRAKRFQSNGSVQFGALSTFSSSGPTVDGRVKPDISGPGQQVWSGLNSFAEEGPQTMEFNGNTYSFAQLSGTSMSGPMVAGIVALMLQANPTLDQESTRDIIRATARLDQHTGEIGADGDLRWGWGKANALEALKYILGVTAISEQRVGRDDLLIYPNPVVGEFTIRLPEAAHGAVEVELYDASGRLRESHRVAAIGKHLRINSDHLSAGYYLVRVIADGTVSTGRVMVQNK